MRNRYLLRTLLGLFALFFAASAFAQATRTWVSGVGDDANPCSRTAPCKTFAGAISKTAAGGIIDVLDPGGFGAVTVTKSITIESIGNVGSILASGTQGVVVNALGTDTVVLRGLSIDGAGTTLGTNGINFLNGAKLVVENCTIQNFSTAGINFQPATNASLVVNDTTVNNNGAPSTSSGILVSGTAASPNPSVQLNNVRVDHSGTGLQVKNGNVSVHASAFSANNVGAKSVSSTAAARIAFDDSIISDSVGAGLTTSGSAASATISRTAITNNGVGISGTVASFGDNRIFNNGADGSPSSTLTQH